MGGEDACREEGTTYEYFNSDAPLAYKGPKYKSSPFGFQGEANDGIDLRVIIKTNHACSKSMASGSLEAWKGA